MIFSFLDPLAFIVAFGMGLMLVYVTNPRPRVVIKFPTPLNAGKVVYREDGECYRYSAEEVDCDSYGSRVRPQVMHGAALQS